MKPSSDLTEGETTFIKHVRNYGQHVHVYRSNSCCNTADCCVMALI